MRITQVGQRWIYHNTYDNLLIAEIYYKKPYKGAPGYYQGKILEVLPAGQITFAGCTTVRDPEEYLKDWTLLKGQEKVE